MDGDIVILETFQSLNKWRSFIKGQTGYSSSTVFLDLCATFGKIHSSANEEAEQPSSYWLISQKSAEGVADAVSSLISTYSNAEFKNPGLSHVCDRFSLS